MLSTMQANQCKQQPHNDEETVSSIVQMQQIEKLRWTLSRVTQINKSEWQLKLKLEDTLRDKKSFQTFMEQLGEEWNILKCYSQFQSAVKIDFGNSNMQC